MAQLFYMSIILILGQNKKRHEKTEFVQYFCLYKCCPFDTSSLSLKISRHVLKNMVVDTRRRATAPRFCLFNKKDFFYWGE